MRILGIDPGYAIVGYGIVDYEKAKFETVGYGAVTTESDMPFTDRLKVIYDDITTIATKYRPDALAIEQLYFTTNQKTAISVAGARGVIMIACINCGIEVFEYTPLQVKQSVVGYGKAQKSQVMEMTKTILRLPQVPKPDDTADALAIAICHAHSAGSLMNRKKLERNTGKFL